MCSHFQKTLTEENGDAIKGGSVLFWRPSFLLGFSLQIGMPLQLRSFPGMYLRDRKQVQTGTQREVVQGALGQIKGKNHEAIKIFSLLQAVLTVAAPLRGLYVLSKTQWSSALEIVQELRMSNVLAEDLSSVPRTHILSMVCGWEIEGGRLVKLLPMTLRDRLRSLLMSYCERRAHLKACWRAPVWSGQSMKTKIYAGMEPGALCSSTCQKSLCSSCSFPWQSLMTQNHQVSHNLIKRAYEGHCSFEIMHYNDIEI